MCTSLSVSENVPSAGLRVHSHLYSQNALKNAKAGILGNHVRRFLRAHYYHMPAYTEGPNASNVDILD